MTYTRPPGTNDCRWIPLCESHFDLFDLAPTEASLLERDPRASDRIQALLLDSVASSLFYDGRILAIAGYYSVWPGVVEVFIFPSRYVEEYSIPYLRAIRRVFTQITNLPGVHRFQTISVGDERTRRWMEWLGFTLEGCLRSYSPDKIDYDQWSIVKP